MSTRAERIRRRNRKKEKEFFFMQKFAGIVMILIGVVLLLVEKDVTWLFCVGLPFGLFLIFTKSKVFYDYHEYEVEE